MTRCPCSTAVIAQKLYVCGGEDGRAANTLERFDPAHDTWELLRPPLHRRRLTTVAVLRDSLYFVGGVGDDGVDIVLDSVESYDTVTDSWEESAPLLNARCVAKVARVNGALFIFGGFGQELDELASVERFDPVTGRWEALPDMTVHGRQFGRRNPCLTIQRFWRKGKLARRQIDSGHSYFARVLVPLAAGHAGSFREVTVTVRGVLDPLHVFVELIIHS